MSSRPNKSSPDSSNSSSSESTPPRIEKGHSHRPIPVLKSGWSLFRRGLVVTIPVLILLYAFSMLLTKPSPRVIRIGTAWPESFYHAFGNDLAESLQAQDRTVQVEITEGTPDNIERLRLGLIDVALIQGGAYRNHHSPDGSKSQQTQHDYDHLALVSPVTIEVIYILVHKQSKILQEVEDHSLDLEALMKATVKGSIYVGAAHSGSHISAQQILEQYGIGLASTSSSHLIHVIESPSYSFWETLSPFRCQILSMVQKKSQGKKSVQAKVIHAAFPNTDQRTINQELLWLVDTGYLDQRRGGALTLAARQSNDHDEWTDQYPEVAIITTNPRNTRLDTLLSTGEYRLANIDATALTQRYPHFREYRIPRRRYGTDATRQPIPLREITTVATTAHLAVRNDAPDELVNALIQARHSYAIRSKYRSNLISVDAIKNDYLSTTPFHSTAEDYYHPFNPDEIATWIEFLSGSKELLITLGAGIYLILTLRRRYREKLQEEAMENQREMLDKLLDETTRIEHAQLDVRDKQQLRAYLDQVTNIKLEALNELTHQDLRGDRRFSIFLMQCANLISKIQFKLLTYHSGSDRQ